MKMIFLTYCDSAFHSIGEISIPIMRKYCLQHNMDFVLHQEITSHHKDVYWNKISIVKNSLANAEWVIWCDADILIQNLDFSWDAYLSDTVEKDLIISSDYNGLCLGFFLIRSCQWSYNLLETMEILGNIKDEKTGLYGKKNRKEQDTLKLLLDFFDSVNQRVALIPEKYLSNPRSEISGKPGFAHHFWANSNPEKIAIEMKNRFDQQP